MKKMLMALVAIIVVGFGVNLLLPTSTSAVNRTTDLKQINYTETFNQDESEYYVYFWQESCSYCTDFEPYVIEAYNDGVPIFLVDMATSKNSNAWYDWDAHHEEHTVVIGAVINGEMIFNEGESEELYPSEEGWRIEANENNELVAKLNKAFNNQEPRTAEEIEIAGTPTLIHIKDGQVVGYSEGVAAGQDLLAQFGK